MDQHAPRCGSTELTAPRPRTPKSKDLLIGAKHGLPVKLRHRPNCIGWRCPRWYGQHRLPASSGSLGVRDGATWSYGILLVSLGPGAHMREAQGLEGAAARARLRETGLRGWAERTRTQKCRRKISL